MGASTRVLEYRYRYGAGAVSGTGSIGIGRGVGHDIGPLRGTENWLGNTKKDAKQLIGQEKLTRKVPKRRKQKNKNPTTIDNTRITNVSLNKLVEPHPPTRAAQSLRTDKQCHLAGTD